MCGEHQTHWRMKGGSGGRMDTSVTVISGAGSSAQSSHSNLLETSCHNALNDFLRDHSCKREREKSEFASIKIVNCILFLCVHVCVYVGGVCTGVCKCWCVSIRTCRCILCLCKPEANPRCCSSGATYLVFGDRVPH